ncbi:MAG TPA: hypothetical protein VJT81_06510 [Burkholderiales bacterium]|nr:hypothetical protein [Burkholderiales bacterium]
MSKRDWHGVGVAIGWTLIAVVIAMAVAVLVLLVQLWKGNTAHAARLSHEHEVMLYAIAYGQYGSAHGGIPMPPRPEIHFDTRANICAVMGKWPTCPAGGYFDNGRVVMADDLDFASKFDASKVVHELVHYLQEQHEGKTKDCRMWIDREVEAYRIQYYLLARDGEDRAAEIVRASARQVRCREPAK